MKTQYLIFSNEVNAQTAQLLSSAVVDAINDEEIDAIYLAIASGGGGVVEGVSLHHQLKASPKPVTTHAIGNVDSIALTVFLAGRARFASPGNRFMFHPLGRSAPQGRIDIPFIEQALVALKSDEERLSSIWLANFQAEREEIATLFQHEHFHDCEWALSRGFIHEVRDFFIPLGSRLRHVA